MSYARPYGLCTMHGSIIIRGARENNLKDVSLDIPKSAITVFTGVSGSGKSSIVFDTIAAESQRLLNDTMPAFVQQFLPHYGQPDADVIDELTAAIIVDQQRIGGNARSTVGTYTDAYTMLRDPLLARRRAERRPVRPLLLQRSHRHVPGVRGPRVASRRSTRTRSSIPTGRSPRARSTSRTSRSTPGTGASSPSPATST